VEFAALTSRLDGAYVTCAPARSMLGGGARLVSTPADVVQALLDPTPMARSAPGSARPSA
jgi:hypothetical protein